MRRRNPYSYGRSVSGEQFVGRRAEIQQLESLILDHQIPIPCSIVGESRIGKSSLLTAFEQILRREQREDLLYLRYDMSSDFREMGDEEQEGRAGTGTFYRNFVSRISNDLSDYTLFDHRAAQRASDPAQQPRMTAHIQSFFSSIRTAGYCLLLILDEFDATTEYFRFDPAGWKLLRTLGNDERYGLSYLFASRRSILTLERDAGISSNLANIFETIRLGLMPDDEARMLVEEPMRRVGLAWPPELVPLLQRAGGNHPYCLQMICSHLFSQCEQRQLPPDLDEVRLIGQLHAPYTALFENQRQRLERSQLFEPLLRLAHGVPGQIEDRQIEELLFLGHLLPDERERNRFHPFSLALDYYLLACGRQMSLWPKVEETEHALQRLVERQYRAHFGEAWLDEIRARNGYASLGASQRVAMVTRWEREREQESLNPFIVVERRLELIQYASAQDLKQLIDQQPQLFERIFPWQTYDVRETALDYLHTMRDTSRVRYRRPKNDDVVQAERACEALLRIIRPVLAQNAPRPLAMRSSERLPQVGDVIAGQYEIVRIVKKTKHSYVVKAHENKLDRDVAIKFLLNNDSSSENLMVERSNLEREGRMLAGLSHPNIGSVYNTTTDPPGVVLAWIESGSLSLTDYAYDDSQDMPLTMVVSLASQLCHALNYIHTRGVIHRDIKPNNILLNEQQTPMLIDFDIARSAHHETVSRGREGTYYYVGNPLYSAPEQFTTPGSVTSAVDIFSLGVVLYELLTHHRPFANYNNPENHKDGLLPPLQREEIPDPLFAILCEMLRQQPEKRPTAQELHKRFTHYLTTLSDETHSDQPF